MSPGADQTPQLRLFAHRGLSARYPENTVASIGAARAEGCTALEFDVQLSRDGEPVVFHDDNLMRLAGNPQAISDLTFAQLQTLDVGRWKDARFAGEHIPHLTEAFAAWGGAGLVNVEIKSVHGADPRLAQAVAAVLRGRPESCVVSSFDWLLLREYALADGERPLAVLIDGERWSAALDCAAELGAEAVNPGLLVARAREIAVARSRGFGVNVYTVNDAGVAKALYGFGVTGVFCDDAPRLAREWPSV